MSWFVSSCGAFLFGRWRACDGRLDSDFEHVVDAAFGCALVGMRAFAAGMCATYGIWLGVLAGMQAGDSFCWIGFALPNIETGPLVFRSLSRYPEVVAHAARNYEPHQVAYFARELANDFHAYYNAHPFIATEECLRLARLSLIDATRQVIVNALRLLGVSAPQSM